MAKKLFNPKKIELPANVLMVPHFWDRDYYGKLRKEAFKKSRFLQGELLFFKEYALVTGFMGYPYLVTILEYINHIKEKEIFFLGTAGSLNTKINSPCSVNVIKIYPSSIFRFFCREESLGLKKFDSDELKMVKGVSVDVIQRETVPWLKKQINRGIDIVEMELFPLRIYLNKTFYAVVVVTDLVTVNGMKGFSDTHMIKKEFIHAFEFIKNYLNN